MSVSPAVMAWISAHITKTLLLSSSSSSSSSVIIIIIITIIFNSLNSQLNPICHLLALLGAHHIVHVSRIRFKAHAAVSIHKIVQLKGLKTYFTYPLTPSLTLLTYPLTYSLTLLTHSLTPSLTHSLYLLTHSLTHFTYPLTHSLYLPTHSLTYFTYSLAHSLTHSTVQSPSWAANWFAARQEIPRISRKPKVHYRTHKRPPPVSILGQPNPVHTPTSHLLQNHPNIIHPSTSRSPQWND